MPEILKAVILGIVEGITEFLPISSTGHLILVNQFISFDEHFTKMFDVIIQFGAILAVLVYFRKKLFAFFTAEKKLNMETIKLWEKVVVGVIPALFIGALLDDKIEELLFNPTTVSIALIVWGIVLVIIESHQTKNKINAIADLSFKTAFFIGLIQCLAMVPGTSRSAVTIIGALLLGCTRIIAVEYSFYLSIPTIMAASAYSLLKLGFHMPMNQVILLATGFIVSFAVALLVIAKLMQYISKRDFKPFGYYRIILGGLVLIYFYLIK